MSLEEQNMKKKNNVIIVTEIKEKSLNMQVPHRNFYFLVLLVFLVQ